MDKLTIFIVLIATIFACDDNEPVSRREPPDVVSESGEVAVKWGNMTLFTLRFSAYNSPTYGSRSLGYLGLTMYESVVSGDPVHRSQNGQLEGLVLPTPAVGETYHWTLSLNASQAMLLKLLYPAPGNSHRFIHERIDSLAKAVYDEHASGIEKKITERSVAFGEAIALAVYDWSRSDGGHEGYGKNFDASFVFPNGPSYWIPPLRGQVISMYPLHPHWGQNRPFVNANRSIPVPAIVPFSTDPASAYYKMYEDVYEKDKVLTLEEREIAAWWGDDPTETFSPPGHSYHMATLAIESSDANLVLASETYARVGIAIADAFINCWKAKYTYFNERPSTYVTKYIDEEWIPFWPEPPFPAFPSGHSMNAGAAATVLTDLYGEPFLFTDHCHEGYRRYDDVRFFDLTYPPRSHASFWEAAEECAYSRFLGGIHTQQDNEVGLEEGRKVGENVNALQWRN